MLEAWMNGGTTAGSISRQSRAGSAGTVTGWGRTRTRPPPSGRWRSRGPATSGRTPAIAPGVKGTDSPPGTTVFGAPAPAAPWDERVCAGRAVLDAGRRRAGPVAAAQVLIRRIEYGTPVID